MDEALSPGRFKMSEKISNSTAVEKALYLYDLLLFSARKYSSADLTAMLQCSKSTVSRLLQQIENRKGLDFRREISEGREWYSLAAPARRPRIICSTQDLDELAACLDKADLEDEDKSRLRDAVQRLRLLFEEDRDVISTAVEPPAKSFVDLTTQARLVEDAARAVRLKQLIQVSWQRGRGTILSWTMAPTGLFATQDTIFLSGWLVPGTVTAPLVTQDTVAADANLQPCYVALHRLQSLTVEERAHDLPAISGSKYFGALSGTPFKVRVRFAAHVADYVQDRHYSDDERMISYSDGTLELEFSARSHDEVVSWLLGFGSSAQLLEPAILVARLKDEMAATLGRYGGVAVYPPAGADR